MKALQVDFENDFEKFGQAISFLSFVEEFMGKCSFYNFLLLPAHTPILQ